MATGLKRINYHQYHSHYNNFQVAYKEKTRDSIKRSRCASFSVLDHIIYENMDENVTEAQSNGTDFNKFDKEDKIYQNGRKHDKQRHEHRDKGVNNDTHEEKVNRDMNGNIANDESSHTETETSTQMKDLLNKTESMKSLRREQKSNKFYGRRKHHSDYDLVYLQVNSKDIDHLPEKTRSSSTSDPEDDGSNLKKHSKSESNLKLSNSITSLPPSGRLRKSTSHKDITTTQKYKEIYADNLRQYGFLLAKQLGTTNKSPDQLRKDYLKNRQKAVERRERAQSLLSEKSARTPNGSDDESQSSRHQSLSKSSSNLSLNSVHSTHSETTGQSKYSGSLTDITNIGTENDHPVYHKGTTVIRRKKNRNIPRDPTKRLSAPLLGVLGLDFEQRLEISSSLSSLSSFTPNSTSSLSVPDLSHHGENDLRDSNESLTSKRKLSVESQRRQDEARERHNFRMSRLTSFDGMLSQADKLMKNIKTRNSNSKLTSTEKLNQTNEKNATEHEEIIPTS